MMQATQSRCHRVLVVDDEAPMHLLLHHVFRRLGETCVPAWDAEEALLAVRRERFDLLVVDIRLPRLSGLDVVRAVRGGDDHTPAVLMSAFLKEMAPFDVSGLEVSGVFEKPLPLPQFVGLVKRLIGIVDRPAGGN